nr:lipoprotein insertase outer membrane protein LolB [Serratia microhaemolytica]
MQPARQMNLLRLLPLASLLLVACSVTQPRGPTVSPQSPQWIAHQQQLQQLTQYQTRGSFAYLSEQKKVYARFFWQQYSADHYRLLLTNPLGGTELELTVQNNQVQLIDRQGGRYLSHDAEAMLLQLTGMAIPINNLRQWMLGLPGNAKDFQVDANYRLKRLTYQQNGLTWQVNYQDFDTNLTPALPNRLELEQGAQRIKLKMDHWTLIR